MAAPFPNAHGAFHHKLVLEAAPCAQEVENGDGQGENHGPAEHRALPSEVHPGQPQLLSQCHNGAKGCKPHLKDKGLETE